MYETEYGTAYESGYEAESNTGHDAEYVRYSAYAEYVASEQALSREAPGAVYGITVPPAAAEPAPPHSDVSQARASYSDTPQTISPPAPPPLSRRFDARGDGAEFRSSFGLSVSHFPLSGRFSASELYPAELRPMLTKHRLRRRRHRSAASMLTGAALAFGLSALKPWAALMPEPAASARGPTVPSAPARAPALPAIPVRPDSTGRSGFDP